MNITFLNVEKRTRQDAIRKETSIEVGIKNVTALEEKRLQWPGHAK
jgi:hypothetical protein